MDFLTPTLSAFTAMSPREYSAEGLPGVYLLRAIKASLWYWPSAFFSTLIYTIMASQGFKTWHEEHTKPSHWAALE